MRIFFGLFSYIYQKRIELALIFGELYDMELSASIWLADFTREGEGGSSSLSGV